MSDLFVVTANRTADGAVVYLDPERRWTARIEDGHQVGEAERESLLAWARTQQVDVCDPYGIAIAATDDGGLELSTRETIRAAGGDAVLRRFGYVE
ncbi:MAG: DUF2849 domain-containing protein [Myxococcota bacterium]